MNPVRVLILGFVGLVAACSDAPAEDVLSKDDAAKRRQGDEGAGPMTPEQGKGNPPQGVAAAAGGCGPVALGPGASLGGARMFPDDNPWNQDVSAEAVDPQSAAILARMGTGTKLHADFGTTWEGAPIGIPYVVVGPDQAPAAINFTAYGDESDPGPYPVPAGAPIEGGPSGDGDRHVLAVQCSATTANHLGGLFELFVAQPQSNGSWNADSGAKFDPNSNALRPAGWTSADAAGLPIFPGLVRYDEAVEQAEIRHALRFTVSKSRKGYVAPARHFASSQADADLPPMGMRMRLKASFDVSTYPAPVQVVLKALKQYGMLLADNGSSGYISGSHDMRWNDEELSSLGKVTFNDFDVVKMGTIVTE
jgi:hypothetical protein